MEIRRPDPDVLLRQVQEAESRAVRAKLKVFLGAAPGVGKTYAMLQEARVRKEAGVAVVAGVVETHGRAETRDLLEGLPVLARKTIDYRGVELQEFDLDGALARRPQLILVDELAHTNAPGSRHGKRWQDVLELLESGIDVYTTVNVQHLEGCRDKVAQITGILIREGVPDRVIDRADEVELVDIAVEELQERLRDGKVYVPAQAQQATQNFFRTGNLLALRELALRRTADRVDLDMQKYRETKGITENWPVKERILAAVGSDPESEQVVRAAYNLARAMHSPWMAVHVVGPRGIFHRESEDQQAQKNLELAEALGAEYILLQPSGLGIKEDLLGLVRDRNASRIVVGSPSFSRWTGWLQRSLAQDLIGDSGGAQVHVVSRARRRGPAPADLARPKDMTPARLGYACGMVVLTTIAAFALRRHLDLADVSMLYVLCIALVAARFGRSASLVASILSVAALDFFFVVPVFTFAVADLKHLGTFAIMLGVGFAIADMAERIRGQARAAQARERHTSSMYRLSAELARAGDPESIHKAVLQNLSERFQADIVLVVLATGGELVPAKGSSPSTEEDLAVAKWAMERKQAVGLGTDTLPGSRGMWLPLVGTGDPVGVLGVIPVRGPTQFALQDRDLLIALAAQAALALERARMQAERGDALRKADREQLRNALLSSVSHDLRTPLGAITGAASTLLDPSPGLNAEGRRDLLLTIHEEARRLHRLVNNLLDITRIESGAIEVHKEWVPIEEVVGGALSRLEDAYQNREVKVDLADLLVPVDPVLIEQVFVNLLENASKYSPDHLPVEIEARKEDEVVTVLISDRGPGIVPGEEERIFLKLVRGSTPQGKTGAGLGLAICRGIIQAHGGYIFASNRPQGGARFSFTLPLKGGPTLPEQPYA